MSWNSEEVADAKERVAREIARRRGRGEALAVVEAPAGSRKLVTSAWGPGWCRHLESFSVYEGRLPRGRSLLRNGKVMDLAVEPGRVTAVVAAAELFDVDISVKPLDPEHWAELRERCAGRVGSLLDLLAGQLGDEVMAVLTDRETGLFPQPGEIRFRCGCPDEADLCPHAAAALYGVGVRLDTEPALLFTLRAVEMTELLSAAQASVDDGAGSAGLAGEDLGNLFGIDLVD